MTPHTERASEVLREALTTLDHGRGWIQGNFIGRDGCCSLGAIWRASPLDGGAAEAKACKFFSDAIDSYGIADWNDDPARTWPEVEAAFQEAITLAVEAEGKSNG